MKEKKREIKIKLFDKILNTLAVGQCYKEDIKKTEEGKLNSL